MYIYPNLWCGYGLATVVYYPNIPSSLCVFITDDNYSYMACGKNPWAWLHRYILRKGVKKLAENCNEIFVMTKTEAKDTGDTFGTKSVVLTKGIDYSNSVFFSVFIRCIAHYVPHKNK